MPPAEELDNVPEDPFGRQLQEQEDAMAAAKRCQNVEDRRGVEDHRKPAANRLARGVRGLHRNQDNDGKVAAAPAAQFETSVTTAEEEPDDSYTMTAKFSLELNQEGEDVELLREEQKSHSCGKCGALIPGDAGYCIQYDSSGKRCTGTRKASKNGPKGWDGINGGAFDNMRKLKSGEVSCCCFCCCCCCCCCCCLFFS